MVAFVTGERACGVGEGAMFGLADGRGIAVVAVGVATAGALAAGVVAGEGVDPVPQASRADARPSVAR